MSVTSKLWPNTYKVSDPNKQVCTTTDFNLSLVSGLYWDGRKNLFHTPFPLDTPLTLTLFLQVFLLTCFLVWDGSSKVKKLQGNKRLRISQFSWYMNLSRSSKILKDAQRLYFDKSGRGSRLWMFNKQPGVFDGRAGTCSVWINTATKREHKVTINSIWSWRCRIMPFMASSKNGKISIKLRMEDGEVEEAGCLCLQHKLKME